MLTLLQSVFYSGICLVLFALLFLPALVSLVVRAVIGECRAMLRRRCG